MIKKIASQVCGYLFNRTARHILVDQRIVNEILLTETQCRSAEWNAGFVLGSNI